MSLPETSEIRPRIKQSRVAQERIIPKACGRGGNGCESSRLGDQNNSHLEWQSPDNLAPNDPSLVQPALNSGPSAFDLQANPVELSNTSWDPVLEPHFPNHLEHIHLDAPPPPASDEFLRHQLGFMSPNHQHDLLNYDHPYPILRSSPVGQLDDSEQLVSFENPPHSASSYNHPSPASNPGLFVPKAHNTQDFPPFVPLNHQISSDLLTTHPPESHPLTMLSGNLGLEYYSLESHRLPPPVGFKRPLSIINHPDMAQSSHHQISDNLPGVEDRRATMPTHDFGVWPSSTSNYTSTGDSLLEAGPSSSQLLWDMTTRSSSSRASSYDHSPIEPIKYSESKTPDYGSPSTLLSSIPTLASLPVSKFPPPITSPRELERRTSHNKKQDSPEITTSQECQPNQKRVGGLLDIHHLTNHVPRRRLTVEQEQILLRRFAVQEYLSKREMEELAEKLKIPTSQLRTWFGNRRSKLKAAARQKAKMEAGMGHLTDAELRNLNKRN